MSIKDHVIDWVLTALSSRPLAWFDWAGTAYQKLGAWAAKDD